MNTETNGPSEREANSSLVFGTLGIVGNCVAIFLWFVVHPYYAWRSIDGAIIANFAALGGLVCGGMFSLLGILAAIRFNRTYPEIRPKWPERSQPLIINRWGMICSALGLAAFMAIVLLIAYSRLQAKGPSTP